VFACCFGSCRAAARTRPTTIAIAGHIMDIDGHMRALMLLIIDALKEEVSFLLVC
jgi:hypothetical protein